MYTDVPHVGSTDGIILTIWNSGRPANFERVSHGLSNRKEFSPGFKEIKTCYLIALSDSRPLSD